MSVRRLQQRKSLKDNGVDFIFKSDWQYIKNKVVNNHLELSNFNSLWKELVFCNNDWRKIPGTPLDIFTRAQGLKKDNLSKFIEDFDYFVGEESLIKFIKDQVKYNNDDHFLPLFEGGMFSSAMEDAEQDCYSTDGQSSDSDALLESDSPNESLSMLISSADLGKIPPEVVESSTLPFEVTSVIGSIDARETIPTTEKKKRPVEKEKNKEFSEYGSPYMHRSPSSFVVGEEVDVIADDIFCPAVIVSANSRCVRIHYVGWDDPAYDSNIYNTARIFPPFSYVQRVKVLVGLCEKIPYWPCVAYIRPALQNSVEGISYLKKESCVFVIPCMKDLPELKDYAKGRWLDTYSFQPYSRNFTRKRPLQPALEMHLPAAMKELEDDPNSRCVPSLRFIGTFEHYTSLEIWAIKKEKQKPIPPPPVPAPAPSVPDDKFNRNSIYHSKKFRGCKVILESNPKTTESLVGFCASALIARQFDDNHFLESGETHRSQMRRQVLMNIQNYRSSESCNWAGKEDIVPTFGTYLLGSVGVRINLSSDWAWSLSS